jgi:hypothetical protein
MKVIGSGLGDYVYHRAAGTSQFCAIGIRGNAKLLHHFVGKLVGSAIAAASLSKEAIVVIGAVHQVTGLIPADSAKREIAIRSRRKTSRILRDARSEQGQISEAPPVQWQFADSTLIDDGRDSGRLGFNQRRLICDRNGFRGSSDCQLEFQLERAANLHMQCRCDLG